jgi:HSP20 family molecular chaperone IbpA
MSDVKVTKVPAIDDRTLPVFAEVERLMEEIRGRAYVIFAGRAFGEGGALDDWLAAEREFCLPAAELTESDTAFTLEVAVAGFEAGEVAVTATPRELIVKAHHKAERREEARREKGVTRWSAFQREDVYRRIELPEAVVVDRITATMRSGLLVIVAPKAKLLSANAVPIKSAA